MLLNKLPFFSHLRGLERRAPRTIALSLIALVALYAGYWLFLTGQLHSGLETFQAEQARNLVHVAVGEVTRTGFPSRAALNLNRLNVQKSGTPEFHVDVPALAIALEPFNPSRGSIASGSGAQHFVFRDAREKISLETTSDTLNGKIALKGFAGAFDYAQLKIGNLAGRWESGDAGDGFSAAQIEAIIRPGTFAQNGEPQNETVFALTGVDVTLPERAGKILGPLVSYATIDAQLTGGKGGPFSLDALARDGAWAVRTFFEGDGRLDITNLALRWGALDASAHGALSLDALHRPVGTLMIEVAGYREVLDGLVREAVLEENEAKTIAGTLDLLAALRRDPRGRVAVILICQKGKLFIGPLEVATLKPVF